MKRLIISLTFSYALVVGVASCLVARPPAQPPAQPDRTAEFTKTCSDIYVEQLGRQIDPGGLQSCLEGARAGRTREQLSQTLHDSAEGVAHRTPTPPQALPGAGESGPLRRDGIALRTVDGTSWRYRGFTDFGMFNRHRSGADIQPLLTERIGYGANTLRVLMVASALFQLSPDGFTDAQADSFFDLTASRGLRVEAVVLVDANPDQSSNPGIAPTLPTWALQNAFLGRMAAVFNRHWNVIGELCNECNHGINRVDPTQFSKPAGPTLWERGSKTADEDPYLPPWDLVGDHPGRVDEWPRRINCKDIIGLLAHGPCVENEPMGAAEADEPGRRATSALDFAQFGAACGLLTNGCLFHSTDGIASQALGPVQAAAGRAFFAGMAFVPPQAPEWPYQRGDAGSEAGIGNMPIMHDDASELRSFCKGIGAEEWCVQIRTKRQHATPRDGWRIVEEPMPGLVRLAR